MPLCLVLRKVSRHRLQVLLSIHLSIRFAIPRELVLSITKDLVDLERLRVCPPRFLDVDFILFFVELDRLDRRIVSTWILVTGSVEAHLLVQAKVLHVYAPFVWAVIVWWDRGLGRLARLGTQ